MILHVIQLIGGKFEALEEPQCMDKCMDNVCTMYRINNEGTRLLV